MIDIRRKMNVDYLKQELGTYLRYGHLGRLKIDAKYFLGHLKIFSLT